MISCPDFGARKALIFHQEDYSLTKQMHPTLHGGLPTTKEDALTAKHMAHGFGIRDKDITYIEDMSIKHIDQVVDEVKREFRELG